MKKQPIYIIGHKNPDTDSIASAIAYADIKGRTCEGEYIAARAGQISEETEYVLKRFHREPPFYISNVGTQVRDMEIRKTPGVKKEISIKNAWAIMKEKEAVTLPITTEDGKLEGLITTGDIAHSYMAAHDSYFLSEGNPYYGNIAETVEGVVAVGDATSRFQRGKVLVGAANPDKLESYLETGDLVILGNRYEDHLLAVNQGAGCLIISVNAKVGDSVRKAAEEKGCVIITTPQDTFTVARLINQSIPVKHIMKGENLITFRTEDFTNDIKETMATARHRAFPVLDMSGQYVGTISRRNFLGMKKKQIILVDHNEKSQTVEQAEEAEILEIIDHHRLGSLETMHPIHFRNQPVGCTSTIMYQIYQEQQLEIKPDIAGLLCGAIISDTLLFRSPTSTAEDQEAAKATAKIAGIDDLEAFAEEMFRAGSDLSSKSPEEIFHQDFKRFIIDKETFGVGQFSSIDQGELRTIRKSLQPLLKSVCGTHGMSMAFFMLTHIVSQSTTLICYGEGSDRLVQKAFGATAEDGAYVLKGVLSRKKQLIPAFMNTIRENL